MTHVLRIGVVDQIAMFRAYNTDGSGKADLVFYTEGLTLSVFRTNLAAVSIASLSDKAADNTAHADGAIRHVSGNLYTVDLPDAATANQCPSIGVRGSYTGGVIEPVPHPIVNYDPSLVAVGANTVTPPTVAEFEARTLPSADYFVVGDFTAPPTVNQIQSGLALEATLDEIKGSTFVEATDALDAVRAAVDGGGGATEAKQDQILGALQGAQVIQVPSPNVGGNLVLTQGDTYDGIGNPKAQWNTTVDYTDGWAVVLTIRDKDDAVVYTNAGTVDSTTLISVAITTPTVVPMVGCPGSWQGKFDVELSKSGSVKTIALGVVYINEDQTR